MNACLLIMDPLLKYQAGWNVETDYKRSKILEMNFWNRY